MDSGGTKLFQMWYPIPRGLRQRLRYDVRVDGCEIARARAGMRFRCGDAVD